MIYDLLRNPEFYYGEPRKSVVNQSFHILIGALGPVLNAAIGLHPLWGLVFTAVFWLTWEFAQWDFFDAEKFDAWEDYKFFLHGGSLAFGVTAVIWGDMSLAVAGLVAGQSCAALAALMQNWHRRKWERLSSEGVT